MASRESIPFIKNQMKKTKLMINHIPFKNKPFPRPQKRFSASKDTSARARRSLKDSVTTPTTFYSTHREVNLKNFHQAGSLLSTQNTSKKCKCQMKH